MNNKKPTSNRPTMDEKQKLDTALNLADFKIDDLANVPGDRLLAEVAEDFGHPEFLAEAFDAIAFPVLSNRSGAVDEGAATTHSAVHALPATASRRASPRPSPAAASWLRAVLAALAAWLDAPLQHRVVTGTFVTLLLVAALAPGIYPRLVERSADRYAAGSKDDPVTRLPELTRLPAPMSLPSPPEMSPAPPGAANQSAAVQTPPPPAPRTPSLARVQPPTEERQAPSAAPAASARAPAPQPMAAARAEPPAEASARGRVSVEQQAAAKSDLTEGSGFVVQLSTSKSEAAAQSTFRALRSKYAVLKGREPVIRRNDLGNRGVSYAVQVGPFASQDDAERLCEQLKVAGGSCFATRN
jgi:cell division septation protein DedD